MRRFLNILIVLGLLGASMYTRADQLYLVANVPAGSEFNHEYGLSLMRGENKNWGSGADARVALPFRDSEHYDLIANSLLGGSGKAMERRWFALVFSGKVNAPKYLEDDSAVMNFIASTQGAIGIVTSEYDKVEGLMVMKIQ